jgi:predicted TIM-barrel fold metal-dependent hydrolase
MFGVKLTDYDKKVYYEELKDFLPPKFIDVHVHLWEPGTKRPGRKGAARWPSLVADSQTFEDMERSFEQLFPGKKVAKVVLGSPSCRLDVVNSYVKKIIQEHRVRALYCTNWDTTTAEIERALDAGFVGIKPYLNNSPPYIPASEVRIFDFLTHEQLKFMDEVGGIVILHIPRAGRLRDPVNLAQLVEIDRKYPRAKVVVAHVGRAYCPEDIGEAFEILRKTKNLVFDFSANTLDLAIEKCIEAVGVGRVMFGSDMPYTKMRMYRTCEDGNYVNVVPRGLYGDVSGDRHMRETDETDITLFMYEELLAFRRAAERLGLTQNEINDIMYKNASEYFGIEL